MKAKLKNYDSSYFLNSKYFLDETCQNIRDLNNCSITEQKLQNLKLEKE